MATMNDNIGSIGWALIRNQGVLVAQLVERVVSSLQWPCVRFSPVAICYMSFFLSLSFPYFLSKPSAVPSIKAQNVPPTNLKK